MLTKKEKARYRAIIRQLSDMSYRGWDKHSHVDWEPLEAELTILANKMTTRLPKAVSF